ncbi:unnamed protein product [Caenorhabditis sp. 36 PRJEB53466]|nr:unnamed protein product [Caenorhabditis sp. 36 PRJEB53466]
MTPQPSPKHATTTTASTTSPPRRGTDTRLVVDFTPQPAVDKNSAIAFVAPLCVSDLCHLTLALASPTLSRTVCISA